MLKHFFGIDQFAGGMGIEIEEFERGYARASFTVRADMLNGAGMGNGGASFALADYTLAIAVNTVSETAAVTAGMNLNYLKPARRGDILRAEAHCHTGAEKPGRMLTGEVVIKNQNGELVASGTGMFYRSNNLMDLGKS